MLRTAMLLMQEYYYSAFKGVCDAESHIPSACVKLCSKTTLRTLDSISRSYAEVVKVFAVFILSFQGNVLQLYTALTRITFCRTQCGNLGVMFNIFMVTFIHIHKILCSHLQCIFRSCS